MDIRGTMLPIAATPALQCILNVAGLLELEPLAHWQKTRQDLLPATYLIAIGAAAIACLIKAQTNRAKAVLIGAGLAVFVASYGAYLWVSTSPPRSGSLQLYDAASYLAFPLTYAAFGFVVARVVKFFAQKR